jgi:hypothetical protein
MSHVALERINTFQGHTTAASKHAEALERLGGEGSVEAEWVAKIDSCLKRLSKPINESE